MHRSRFSATSAAMATLALLLAACGGAASSPSGAATDAAQSIAASTAASTSAAASASSEASEAASDEVRVTLDGFAFDPEELTVAIGTEVTFVNADSAAHTVTEGSDGQAADDPVIDDEIAANQATSHTFDEPGTYQITCLFHPSMNMTVTVES